MSTLSKLREAVERMNDDSIESEDNAIVVLECAEALVASPEFARFELEQASRKRLGLNEHWTVIVQHGAKPPTRFVATQQSILVGADWRPEVKL